MKGENVIGCRASDPPFARFSIEAVMLAAMVRGAASGALPADG